MRSAVGIPVVHGGEDVNVEGRVFGRNVIFRW